MNTKLLGSIFAVMAASVAVAEVMDRPVGIRIGQRMTLKPYVSFSASYDTNVDCRKGGDEDIVWMVNPGLGLEYKADTWSLLAQGFYQFNAYSKHNSQNQNNYHAYGENLVFKWDDTDKTEPGWSLLLSEKYEKFNQLDDVITSSGSAYSRNRQEFKSGVGLERRFTSNLHADINAGYYWLDYDADRKSQWSSYGWDRWEVGLEGGWVLSNWTDLLLAGMYQGYTQENTYGLTGFDDTSEGYTVQGGIGSFATEHISYRLLAGWSLFQYGNGADDTGGLTYTATSYWRISDTWTTIIMATSYYQPSERYQGTSQRVDELSWGLAHTMVSGKLHTNFDIAYRRESHEYSYNNAGDYDLDIVSYRMSLNYTLNRYLVLFGIVEYRMSTPSGGTSGYGEYYDYDRFRGTLGVRFTY